MAEEPGVAVRATNRFRSDLPVARSAYLHQVAQIAPAELIGRERELAELAEFCTAPATSGRYLWWRAEAWSGKTALLSSFVLNPPDLVRVVSFFITGRLSGQNDQTAFLDNVLEQLFTLLGEDVPDLLTEATKHAHLLRLLDTATADCLSRSESFVLVVDGLDEDSGAGEHSIASLLPVRLPDGMRVVVAGRPNPPADAPDDHPLRSGAAEVRSLEPSPSAVALRRETERELKALLHAAGLERDLLALICAAGGGLTAADLAVLTETSPYEVEELLSTVAGRSFASRDDAYLLAHEELQVTAATMFGPQLASYRDRLHSWVDEYRDLGWPESAPEYLLHGYAAMLRSPPDPERLVRLVTDQERQARLLARTGGDAAEYSQILAAQQIVVEHTPADLLAMAKLAVARGALGAQNSRLPVVLPAVWESLGQPQRAAALAHGIVGRKARSEALALLAKAVADAGDISRAQDTAECIIDSWWRARAFTDLTLFLVRTGDNQRAAIPLAKAKAATNEITDAEQRARAFTHLARALYSLGDRQQASAMLDAAEPHNPDDFALLTIELVGCAETVGDVQRAERIAYAASDRLEQVILLCTAATEALDRGCADRAVSLLDKAVVVAMRLETDRIEALATICRSAAAIDDRAAALSDLAHADNSVEELHYTTLAALVDCSLACGDLEKAEDTARLIGPPAETAEALAEVAHLALVRGDRKRADALIAELAASNRFENSLGDLALWSVQLGESGYAAALAERAETISRENVSYYLNNVASDLVSAFCLLKWFDEAEAIASTITSTWQRADVLLGVLTSLVPNDDRERLLRLADEVDAIWTQEANSYRSGEISKDLVKVLVTAREFGRATAVIDSIQARPLRVMAMAGAALATAPVDPAMAIEFAERAELALDSLTNANRAVACSEVAAAWFISGHVEQALKMIETELPSQHYLDLTWHAIATSGVFADKVENARLLTSLIKDPFFQESALVEVAAAMVRAGQIHEAEQLTLAMEYGPHHDTATHAVAIALAETGEFSRARRYVYRMARDEPAALLGELAMVAADTGDVVVAKQFLMEALTTSERWSKSLKALGKLDPDALREISALLLSSRS